MAKQKKTIEEQVNEMTREQQDRILLEGFKLDLICAAIYLVVAIPCIAGLSLISFMLTTASSSGNFALADILFPILIILSVVFIIASLVYGIVSYVFIIKKYAYSFKKFLYIRKMRKAEKEQNNEQNKEQSN